MNFGKYVLIGAMHKHPTMTFLLFAKNDPNKALILEVKFMDLINPRNYILP